VIDFGWGAALLGFLTLQRIAELSAGGEQSAFVLSRPPTVRGLLDVVDDWRLRLWLFGLKGSRPAFSRT
jgi:hypothetical protein